jgi:2-methylisocitrate lyase-like PEP mutase family enzyme
MIGHTLESDARRLRELHQIGQPLLLVNVWDVAGARAVRAAGSLAIGTSSVAMRPRAGARTITATVKPPSRSCGRSPPQSTSR